MLGYSLTMLFGQLPGKTSLKWAVVCQEGC